MLRQSIKLKNVLFSETSSQYSWAIRWIYERFIVKRRARNLSLTQISVSIRYLSYICCFDVRRISDGTITRKIRLFFSKLCHFCRCRYSQNVTRPTYKIILTRKHSSTRYTKCDRPLYQEHDECEGWVSFAVGGKWGGSPTTWTTSQ